MKLVVGLGNPGRKYEKTRHNVGFETLTEVARRFDAGRAKRKFKGEIFEFVLGGSKVMLLMPQTYMNLSGESVQLVRGFYQIDNSEVLVVCDDFNLPLGQLRFRARGSSGGQKGLGDIVRRLGTDMIPRLRIGIGGPPEGWDLADYVLSRFRADDESAVSEMIGRAAEGVADWVRHDMAFCMNRYNSRSQEQEKE